MKMMDGKLAGQDASFFWVEGVTKDLSLVVWIP
jgi:hypothetical protein